MEKGIRRKTTTILYKEDFKTQEIWEGLLDLFHLPKMAQGIDVDLILNGAYYEDLDNRLD